MAPGFVLHSRDATFPVRRSPRACVDTLADPAGAAAARVAARRRARRRGRRCGAHSRDVLVRDLAARFRARAAHRTPRRLPVVCIHRHGAASCATHERGCIPRTIARRGGRAVSGSGLSPQSAGARTADLFTADLDVPAMTRGASRCIAVLVTDRGREFDAGFSNRCTVLGGFRRSSVRTSLFHLSLRRCRVQCAG